jgi:hypothetical protein
MALAQASIRQSPFSSDRLQRGRHQLSRDPQPRRSRARGQPKQTGCTSVGWQNRVASSRGMDHSEPIDVELTADELRLLTAGLVEWGGPARCTEPLARAMGFTDVEDLFRQSDRLTATLRDAQPLSRRDWTRALLATEIVFASDVVGSGWDWHSTVGWSDEKTIHVLRQLQRKLRTAHALSSDAI